MNQRYLLPLLALNLGFASACGEDGGTDTGTDTDTDTDTDTGSKPATPVGTWDLQASTEGGTSKSWPRIERQDENGFYYTREYAKVLTVAQGSTASWSYNVTYTCVDDPGQSNCGQNQVETYAYDGTWMQTPSSQTYSIAFDDQADINHELKLTLECTLGTDTLSCNDTSSDDTYTFKAASAE